MDDNTKRKLAAGGKVVVGGARMVSGIVTAAGCGIIGTFLRHRHMQRSAVQIGRISFEGGKKMFQNGWSELHQ